MSIKSNDGVSKTADWVAKITDAKKVLIESVNGSVNKVYANGFVKALGKLSVAAQAVSWGFSENKAKASLGLVAGVAGGVAGGVFVAGGALLLGAAAAPVALVGGVALFGSFLATTASDYLYDNSDTVRKNADNAWNKVTNAIKGANAGNGVSTIEEQRRAYAEQQKVSKQSETEMASLQQQLKAEKTRLAGQADSSSASSSDVSISSDSGSSSGVSSSGPGSNYRGSDSDEDHSTWSSSSDSGSSSSSSDSGGISIMLAVNDNHIKQHLLVV